MRRNKIAIALRIARKRKADGGSIYGDIGGAMPEAYADPNVGLGSVISNAVKSVATLPQRAIEGAAQYQPGSGSVPDAVIGPALEAATLPMGTGAIAGVPVRAGEAVLGAGPIRAYHGSPHDFDAFSMDKIGTGEGAQAYGHGLYFAENEGIAKSYRDALSLGMPDELAAQRRRLEGLQSELRESADNAHDFDPIAIQKEIQRAQSNISRLETAPNGRMYEVNIDADPEHFLDWDKPLSGQHPKVQEVLGSGNDTAAAVLGRAYRNDMHAGDLIGKDRASPTELTQGLAERGIPGIKYLDAGSRAPKTLLEGKPIPADHDAALLAAEKLDLHGTPQAAIASLRDNAANGHPYIRQASKDAADLLESGKVARSVPEGSRNYVVFNDKMIDILKKYGLAGLPAAGVAASSTQGNDQHMAKGGKIRTALRIARKANGGGVFSGYIHGTTGGRTDNKPIDVESGAYVVPADILSGLGEGNSHAGWAALQAQFGMGAPAKADGGAVGQPTPIVAASGEGVIDPGTVAKIGGGDLDKGHQILDAMVAHVRKKTIKTLKGLPKPKRS